MQPPKDIKVLIVDDSALVRSILTRVLSEQPGIRVVGGAAHPYEARELIIEHRPDVIILDIEMPRMDGITFLRKLMAHYPVPVIMCSSIAPSSSRIALEAVEIGAVDVVAKPTSGGRQALLRLGEELADKVRAANMARRTTPQIPRPSQAPATTFREAGLEPSRYVIAIGASTGGTEAIKALLECAPPDFPPVVMVQHMPEGFTRSFAERLNQHSSLTVVEAVDGSPLHVGEAFLARGGIQMAVTGRPGFLRITYGSSEPVNRHCPSVEVLFDSLARLHGVQTVGVLLTGMGADGAEGLLRLRQAGAVTIAQTQESCVVFGMPKVAIDLGAAEATSTPPEVPRAIIRLLQERKTRRQKGNTRQDDSVLGARRATPAKLS